MCCRSQCGHSCGCGNSVNNGCGSASTSCGCGSAGTNSGCGCQQPVCGWAYVCQYPGHRPMPLSETSARFEETSGCGCA